MAENKAGRNNWKIYAAASLMGIVAVTFAAALSNLWVLTAIPIGFLFGFFVQRGDLCGASAFSEIIMMGDRRKVFGLWIVIVVAMIGFAALDSMALVDLNPKPLLYLNFVVGGIIFGVGTVLAGGCVSGCMYKAATGNLNSIVAMLGIPVGVMLVEYGPLHPFQVALKSHIIKLHDGGAVSLPAILQVPFWLLAVSIAVLTIAITFHRRKDGPAGNERTVSGISTIERILTRPWKAWAAGLMIGLLMIPAYLSSAASGRNYPLGVTHGVMQAELLLIDKDFTHVWRNELAHLRTASEATDNDAAPRSPASPPPTQARGKKVVWWLVALVVCYMLGAWVSGRMTGQAGLKARPPDEVLVALFGGLLVGTGAALAAGCVVGNIMSGWALMSVGTIIFGIVVVLSNWATTYFYMMGGESKK